MHWQDLSYVTILELWSLLKDFNSQGKSSMVNCTYFQSISAFSTVVATHPLPQPLSKYCACVPEADSHSSQGPREQKRSCPPNTGHLCSNHLLLCLMREMQMKNRVAIAIAPPPTTANSSYSGWSDFHGV